MNTDDLVIFPSTGETVATLSAMLDNSDPPLVTQENLVHKSVSLLKGIFDATRPKGPGPKTKELIASRPEEPRLYDTVPFPFWLDWEWEPKGGDAAWDEDHFIGLMLSTNTRLQAEYLMTFAPKLKKEGHVISAGLWLFRSFQESQGVRKFAVFDRSTGDVSRIGFPFWSAPA